MGLNYTAYVRYGTDQSTNFQNDLKSVQKLHKIFKNFAKIAEKQV